MGVVSTTVSAIQTDLAEAEGEFTATIDKLLQSESATKLDAEDLAALESLKTQAARLKNIVPNAVTIPLPDPENTVDLNPTANDVLDPATVTPVDAVEPAPAPADEAAASDTADETPNGDTNTSNS